MSHSYVVWKTPHSRLITGSHPLDDLAAEEPVRPDHEGQDHEDVRQEVLGPAAHIGIDIAGGDALDAADDEPAEDGPGHAVQASEDHRGEYLEADQRQLGVHPEHITPDDTADTGGEPRDSPRQGEDETNLDAHRHGCLLVVGHGPHGDA